MRTPQTPSVHAAAKNALGGKWADHTLRFTTHKPGESPKQLHS